MIRAHVTNMFRAGESRETVEAFLRRFKLGPDYIDMLDDLRTEARRQGSSRGGLRARLRRRSE